jgi:hypothetical protein
MELKGEGKLQVPFNTLKTERIEMAILSLQK